ncbi:CRISPR system Cascade subunit CasA [Nocardiopsis mwathae]|uniref:CRISPR system Cascade subunit CasA n=2 Tax=Nocardiopsis mwathae TaxID=1472723 RepID=A0A7W9YFQ0_9ACTN|nr:CRISPR system Cascade subunit CasA [Nocardiopsis mwathae]
MADSAAVAGRLWDVWLPRQVKDGVSAVLPGGADDARAMVVWLAAVHDIGKATPAFACQVDELAGRMRDAGLGMPTLAQMRSDRRLAPHGLAGLVLLREWLVEHHAWRKPTALQLAAVVGGHHGVPPTNLEIGELLDHPALLRARGSEEAWRHVQTELLDAAAAETGALARLDAWRDVKLPQTAQVVFSALVIVADWMASSRELFPHSPDAPLDDPGRAENAWAALDLPRPWEPDQPVEGTAAELFAGRFQLPADAVVRPVQEQAVRAARDMAGPGMLVVEAPMGEGKTEAALAAAEILAAHTGSGGCFVALPTMATGNAMFPRVLSWLENLPGGRTDPEQHSVFLAHSKNALNDDYAALLRGGRQVTDIDRDGAPDRPSERAEHGKGDLRDWRGSRRHAPAELVAHSWLRGRKKGPLASFVVGTIDQLLFTGLKSRHLALRHLAVAGKTVIIDEAHAYDAYMSTYLDRVLAWLGAYGVPVVVLSATLPARRRRELAAAYARARRDDTAFAPLAEADGYPLITAVPAGRAPSVTAPEASGRSTDVRVERLDDDLDTLAALLTAELADGGCAAVVRNTVSRVHETAHHLREHFARAGVGITVEVAHSRFVALDRAENDSRLLADLGPPDRVADLGGTRPTSGHVVVASQVVEQSLDIDFDLMVTDLAPIDLILQRMGRLHRHRRGEGQCERPRRLRTARCLVTGADWTAGPPQPARGSTAVYPLYLLLRAAAVLEPHLSSNDDHGRSIRLPDAISPLVQHAYADAPAGPPAWQDELEQARRDHAGREADQEERAADYRVAAPGRAGRSLVGWVDAGVGDADETPRGRAQVRDSAESLEVLVVRRRADGSLATLPDLGQGLGDQPIPEDTAPPPRLARIIAGCSARLPYQFTLPRVIDQAIEELEDRNYFPAWQHKDCHWLAGELILVLDENLHTNLAGYRLTYSRSDGFEVRMANEPPVLSFDLTERPWIPVQRLDGSEAELSLRQVFVQADTLRRISGDLPTQEFALLRLLLAILHDVVDGPADAEEWHDELWAEGLPITAITSYLDTHRSRFDLLHPSTPFLQVADLTTGKRDVTSLDKIVADVPNGARFFTMRAHGAPRLGFAEAARWIVHAHAYDPSGIKSGALGDPRVKSGKGYPLGVGGAGNLGGVYVEGDDLSQTLILNLIATEDAEVMGLRTDDDDRPAWRFPPSGAAPLDTVEQSRRPYGLRDLYTWQSRRVRLHYDTAGVHGVLLAYGDPLAPQHLRRREPMTAWRRSPAQEKKLGRALVYMPREHDPAISAWRGLGALITGEAPGSRQRQEAASGLPPRIVEWIARLARDGYVSPTHRIRLRLAGAVYGTQQSVIDEVVDDRIDMAVALLHERESTLGQEAVDAVRAAERAVGALANLASNLAQAAGEDQESPRATARDHGYGELEAPFREHLRRLLPGTDPAEWQARWHREAYRAIRGIGADLVKQAGEAAWTGRVIGTGDRSWVLDAAYAEGRFHGELRRALDRSGDGPADQDTGPGQE